MSSLLRRLIVRTAVATYRRVFDSQLRAFENSLRDPREAQRRVLAKILREIETTEYGRSLGLSRDLSATEFRLRVSVHDFEDFEPWIEKQKQTMSAVFTPGPLVIFEKTSGSRGAAKWIPYNRALLKSFERMFVLWSLDLFRAGLKLNSGKVFFLISPRLTAREHAANGVPVGFQDDSGYLGRVVGAVGRLFFVDSSRGAGRAETFLDDLCLSLLRERDLEVISMWSPSLLVLVCEHVARNRKKFAFDQTLASATREALASGKLAGDLHAVLWPDLQVVSAWDASTSAGDAHRIRLAFPHAEFQGKGLLATEAAMTIPWKAAGGQVPIVDDLYLEFEDPETKEVYALDEIKRGREYLILISAPNGFLRYRIGDRVRVSKFYEATPCLEFVGRRARVSDLVGEKLNADFVEDVLDRIFVSNRPFSLVVPQDEGGRRRYVLAIDAIEGAQIDHDDEDRISACLEIELRKQHHYNLAIQLGQLVPAVARRLPGLRQFYFENRPNSVAQAGQIKNETLVTDPNFAIALDVALRRHSKTSHRSRSSTVTRL